MSSTNQIQILEAPASLTKYTHASLDSHAAEQLASHVGALRAAGAKVLSARGAKSSVPNKYGAGAYRMHAPHWVLKGDSIVAADGRLETRSGGARIPARFTIEGLDKAPAGYRTIGRYSGVLDIIA